MKISTRKNKHVSIFVSNVSPSPIQTILSVPELHQVHRSVHNNARNRSCHDWPGSRTDEKAPHAGKPVVQAPLDHRRLGISPRPEGKPQYYNFVSILTLSFVNFNLLHFIASFERVNMLHTFVTLPNTVCWPSRCGCGW